MRIAVYHELPSGGAKRALFETVRRLAERHTVDVFSLSAADHEFCDLRPVVHGHSIASFEPRGLFRPPWARLNRWQQWRDLRRLEGLGRESAAGIDAGNYDVAYVHPSQWTQAPTALGHLRTPSVYHVHDFRAINVAPIRRRYRGGWEGWWSPLIDWADPITRTHARTLRDIDARSTGRATTVLANSQFTAANVATFYGREAHVSYFGVDSRMFRPLENVAKQGFVLSVGAVRAEKGFDFLIESLAGLPNLARPPLRIVANADFAPEHEYLLDLARQCRVDVRIEIDPSQQALVERYNQATLFVYAPVREPFGLVALEAMACGLPVVGVAEGGVAESVIDGVGGRLVERDAGRFGQLVATLLADDALCGRLGEQARRHAVERWSWEGSLHEIERHLAAAAGGKAS